MWFTSGHYVSKNVELVLWVLTFRFVNKEAPLKVPEK